MASYGFLDGIVVAGADPPAGTGGVGIDGFKVAPDPAAIAFFGCPVGALPVFPRGTVGCFPELLSGLALRAGISFLSLCLFRFAGAVFPTTRPPLPLPPLWRRFPPPPTFFPLATAPGFDLLDPSLLVEDDGVLALLAFAVADTPAMSIPST